MRSARSVFAVLVAILLAALPARPALAEDHWAEVRSPHFRVLTNGTAADGRRVIDEFEDMRYVIHYRFPTLRLDSSAPLLIAAPRDLSSAERLEPTKDWMHGTASGNFIPGLDRNYATVRLDSRERGAKELVFSAYVESVLSLNAPHLPTWFRHGLSEFFAYTRFSDGRIYVGAPSERTTALNDGRALPLSIIMSMDEDDAFRDRERGEQFFADSWALVHYLTFASGMGNGQKLAEFFSKLQAGIDQKVAFRATFGDPDALDPELRTYMGKFLSTAGVVPAAPPLDPKLISERELSPAEADYWRATVHLGTGDKAGGKQLIGQALGLDPKLGEAHEEMGYLLYSQGNDDDARAQWKEASTLDPTLYRARFAYLMTGTSFKTQNAEQQQGSLTELRAILHLDPRFAPAYVEVALLHWQRGDLDSAQRAAEEAERMEPLRPGYHLLTAHILLAQGKGAAAARIARSAAQLASLSARDEAVALWMEVPPTQRGDGPRLDFEQPAGTQVARGRLSAVQCDVQEKLTTMTTVFQPAGPATAPLQLTTVGKPVLGVEDTLYRGEQHMSACQHSSGRNALVAYKPTQSGQGELVWLQVLDDLPASPTVAAAPAVAALPLAPISAATQTAATK